jgi:hypothetical protein
MTAQKYHIRNYFKVPISRFWDVPRAPGQFGAAVGLLVLFAAMAAKNLLAARWCSVYLIVQNQKLEDQSMHLTTRRLFHLGFTLLAATVPAFCQPACGVVTPEPSYVWLIGAGSGAILLLRKLRSKK